MNTGTTADQRTVLAAHYLDDTIFFLTTND